MNSFKHLSFLIFLVSFLTGCATKGANLTYYRADNSSAQTTALLEKVKEIERQTTEDIHLESIGKDDYSSHHLVLVRSEEPLHYHANHDLWVIALQGRGVLWVGRQRLRIHPGASFYIPRGLPHQALNKGRKPLAGLVIFTPPLENPDTVVIKG